MSYQEWGCETSASRDKEIFLGSPPPPCGHRDWWRHTSENGEETQRHRGYWYTGDQLVTVMGSRSSLAKLGMKDAEVSEAIDLQNRRLRSRLGICQAAAL